MAEIQFEGNTYVRAGEESVLDCLLRNGVALEHSCKSGICQSCMLQAVGGDLPPKAQTGLRDTHRSQGFFLACNCLPEGDLEIVRANGQGLKTPAVIDAIDLLNETVARVRVQCHTPPEHRAGQFFNLVRPDGHVRSYSVASVPQQVPFIEFHVAHVEGGRMSTWLHEQARPGDALDLMGPAGNCFYVPGDPGQPLLLIGTGTGLAPLYGIARDALRQGHTGPIHLFSGSVAPRGLYLVDELCALATAHAAFHYYPCVLRGDGTPGIHEASIDTFALETAGPLKGWKVYLCGNPDIVRTLQRKTFLAGASLNAIYADAFVPSPA
jgi:NAD(P)H-flavin reductase